MMDHLPRIRLDCSMALSGVKHVLARTSTSLHPLRFSESVREVSKEEALFLFYLLLYVEIDKLHATSSLSPRTHLSMHRTRP
mmetsp:Transcript_66327/g.115423  ORF Transcript_66327/g.115423 Transcript_66327/m.115423 type:complete len:82 (+) Transcript_66327:122-367(+)